MSDYTITLKRITEVYGEDTVLNWFQGYSLENYLSQEQMQVVNEKNIFHKDMLAEMILKHYYFREIAFETPEMFLVHVYDKLGVIMRNLCSNNLFFKLSI